MPVENQVVVIYAVTNGYLDDVAASEGPGLGEQLPRVHARRSPGVRDAIRTRRSSATRRRRSSGSAIEAHKKLFRTAAAEEPDAEAAG